MSFTIRPATPNDYDGIEAVSLEGAIYHARARPDFFLIPQDGPSLAREAVEALIKNHDAALLVAERQERIVSFLIARVYDLPPEPVRRPCRMLMVDIVVVTESQRGTGVGQALMKEAERWGTSRNADRAVLNVWDFNKPAIGFYQKQGYTPAFVRLEKLLRPSAE